MEQEEAGELQSRGSCKVNIDGFKIWLGKQGAEVLAPTNAYELVRFRARSAVHVIYKGRRGITAGEFAEKCLQAFQEGRPLGMGLTERQRGQVTKHRAALIQRDGDCCFFCIKPLGSNITIEHLVAHHKGGPDHMDNLALAHEACNKKAANMALMQKIKLREQALLQPA